MTSAPDTSPHAIATRLLAAFRRQAATTSQGRSIAAAGLTEALDALLACCANNVANGLSMDVEDAVEAALASR